MSRHFLIPWLVTVLISSPAVRGADTNISSAVAPAAVLPKELFPDEVVCRGSGVEIHRSQVDRAFVQYRANASARGQTVPEAKRAELEALLLDRLVVTELLMNRATAEDKARAKDVAARFTDNIRRQAGSEETFERQVLAMGFTVDDLESQILERAVCEEVVNRELESKVIVTDEQVRQFYEANPERMQRPERLRASHLLLSTRNAVTDEEYNDTRKKEKHRLMEELRERARKGEDFAALVREYSEDIGSREKGGEYTFQRGQMVPEFERAAFALKTNQISDIVTTRFGYHIIKLHERIPAEKIEFADAENGIRDTLTHERVQEELLPEFLLQLKAEAKLEYLNGAQPPRALEAASAERPSAKTTPP